MNDAADSPEVTTELTEHTVSATAHVDASPHEVFEYVRRPANHAAISGDRSVTRATSGADVLAEGSKFGAAMHIGPFRYRIRNKVVEFEQDRRLAWSHFGGHRWRWEFEPDDGGTRVTETYDQSTALIKAVVKLQGLPAGHRDNVKRSVANVAAHFAGTEPSG